MLRSAHIYLGSKVTATCDKESNTRISGGNQALQYWSPYGDPLGRDHDFWLQCPQSPSVWFRMLEELCGIRQTIQFSQPNVYDVSSRSFGQTSSQMISWYPIFCSFQLNSFRQTIGTENRYINCSTSIVVKVIFSIFGISYTSTNL